VDLIITTTIDNEGAAQALARSAVERQLAACAQVSGPIHSVYRWEGAVETASEWLVTFKTTQSASVALADHIRAEHSYQTPEIVAVEISPTGSNPAYLSWIQASVTPAATL
jgi:periplasmic divalent cation tolerance protein